MNTTKNSPSNIHQLSQQIINSDGDFDYDGVLNTMPIKSLQEMNDECLADIYETALINGGDSYNVLRPMKRHKSSKSSDLDTNGNAANQYDEGVNVYTDPICLSDLPDLNSTSSVTAALLYNLGLANLQRDQGETALRFFHLALDKCKKGNGLDSISEISILHNIGVMHYHQQEFEKALKTFTRVEVLSRIKHGPHHLSVASALNCIGVVLFKMNGTNSENVLANLSEALSIRLGLGSSDIDVATTLNNIGRVYFDIADFHKAILYYQKSLQIRRKTLGPNHMDVAATAFNAGQTCHKLGLLNKALSLYQAYYEITSKHDGQNHQGTITALKNIGQVFHEKNQVKEARRHYEAALKSSCKLFGKVSREVASILNLLGNLFYENKDFDKAIEVYEEGLLIERAVLDCHSNNIVCTLSNIGQSLMQKGDYQAALSKYNEVHFIQCSEADTDRSVKKISEVLSIIGQINTLLGKYSQAENAFLKVISATRETCCGDHDIDIPLCLNYLGLVYFKQGELNSAMDKFQESLRVRKGANKTSSDVAVLLYNIASIYLHKGDTENALKHYKRALEVERNALGPRHPDVAITLKLIGKVYDRCGKYVEAIQSYSEALEIYMDCHSSGKDTRDHKKNAARILALIASVHLRQANTEEMTVALSRAYRLFHEIGAPVHELELDTGFDLYELSILHPECAAAA